MTTSSARGRLAPLLLGAALTTGALIGAAGPATAAPGDVGTLCSDYDTPEEAQAAVDAGEVDTTLLDPDGDGRACEEEELAREGVTCPPEEVSDLVNLLPGECDRDDADPDVREGMVVPVGGVDAGAGGAAGPAGLGALLAGAGLVAAGAGGLVVVRRRLED